MKIASAALTFLILAGVACASRPPLSPPPAETVTVTTPDESPTTLTSASPQAYSAPISPEEIDRAFEARDGGAQDEEPSRGAPKDLVRLGAVSVTGTELGTFRQTVSDRDDMVTSFSSRGTSAG